MTTATEMESAPPRGSLESSNTAIGSRASIPLALAVASVAACLVACGDRQTAPPSIAGPDAESAALRSGHRNAEYSIGGQPVRLADGVSQAEAAPGSATRVVTRYFGNEARGDLNADGREDVVFLLTQESGGSGTFYYAVAALDSERGYSGSQGVLLGDRIAPQGTELKPDGVVVVSYADRAPGAGLSTSPSVNKSIWLKLDPATLQFAEVEQSFEGEADPAAMTLDMKTWIWVRAVFNDGRELVPQQADAFTLTFRADGSFAATTDCNRVNGRYTVNAPELTFGDLAATRMFCERSQEPAYTDLLDKTSRYFFTSQGQLVLELALDSGSVIFR
jgi:heat shock protein HslJ